MVYGGHHQLVPHPKPLRRKLEGLGDPLTPSVQTFETPNQTGNTTTEQLGPGAVPGGVSACPAGYSCGPDGRSVGGILECPPPFVYYPSYVDTAGNAQYPGCMMPQVAVTTVAPKTQPTQPVSPSPSAPSSSTATTTTTASTSTSAGPSAVSPPSDGLLLLGVVLLALVVLK